MEFRELDEKYLKEAAALAVECYEAEQEKIGEIYTKNYQETIYHDLKELFNNKVGTLLFDKDELIGYLAFWGIWDSNRPAIKATASPVFGYGIKGGNKERIMSMLFQHMGEKLLAEGVGSYEIKVYAHDKEAIDSYVFNQFGILCTDTIKDINDSIIENLNDDYSYDMLTKEEIKERTAELLALYQKLVKHLRKSPTFYPGEEFTDKVYMDYILDPETMVFAAKDGEKIIAILDANNDGNCFVTNEQDVYNVGDIYVEKAYRGKGVAQSLLQMASFKCRDLGAKKLWVEHGTANPNARGFWDKYFKPYSYTLTREIDERMVKKEQ